MAAPKKTAKTESSFESIMAELNNSEAGSVMMVEDFGLEVDRIPCGVLSVDLAIGGGFPRGKITELYGAEASGKTSLTSRLAAEVQKTGLNVLYVDAENAMDLDMMRSSGVDTKKLAIAQPSSGEKALEIVDKAVSAKDLGLIVVDSVSALTPRAEIEGDYGDSHMGLQARMMSQGMRKITSRMTSCHSEVILVFINQIRANIGGYGANNTTSGGRALKFYAGLRVEVTRTGQIKGSAADSDPIGHTVKIKTTKNRTAPPMRTVGFDMLYDRGISNGSCILDMGESLGVIVKGGNTYSDASTGEKIGVGRMKAINELDGNEELASHLSELIAIKYNGDD